MKKVIYFLAVLNLGFLVGCASRQTTSKAQAPIAKTQKVLEMEKRLREREEAQQDIRDRNQVLNKKAQMESPPSAVKLQARPQSKKIEMISGNDKNLKSDREL